MFLILERDIIMQGFLSFMERKNIPVYNENVTLTGEILDMRICVSLRADDLLHCLFFRTKSKVQRMDPIIPNQKRPSEEFFDLAQSFLLVLHVFSRRNDASFWKEFQFFNFLPVFSSCLPIQSLETISQLYQMNSS